MKQFAVRTQKISFGVVIAIFVASFFTSLVPVQSVFAAPADDSSNNPSDWFPETRAKRWATMNGLYSCQKEAWGGANEWVDGVRNDRIEQSNATSGKWFYDPPSGALDAPSQPAGYIDVDLKGGEKGFADCNDITTAAASAYGISPVQLLCKMGGSREDGSPCEGSGSGSKFKPPDSGDRMDMTEFWGSKNLPDSAGGAAYYALNLAALMSNEGCSLKADNNASGDFAYELKIVGDDGKATTQKFTGQKRDHEVNVYSSIGLNDQKRKCSQLESDLSKYSADYVAWAMDHEESLGDNDDNGEGEAAESSCAIDGVGWIVCPVMIFVGKMNDAAFGFLEEILGIRPAVVTSESTQAAWAAFRDIANVAFVIAFMVIVYSQITSAGISNYGIKKMLPRIVIAAILVNVSFIICAIAVDLSNIVGASIYSLFQNSIAPDVGSDITNASWEETIAGALALATTIGVILIVVLFFIGPMALLALGLIILILVARQALVILLIVMAPLAFVAYLLPNTEDWFKKWYKAFIAVLMVYPIVGAVFGVSTLASRVLSSVAADTEDSSLLQVIALGVLAVPLFAVPAILKGSLSAAGSIGARVSKLADRTQGSATKRGKERLNESAAGQYMAYRGQEGQRKRALARSGKAIGSNKNPLNWRRNATAAAMSRFNASGVSGSFGDRLAAGGADLEDKMWDEEVGRQKKLITVGNNMTNEAILSDLASGKGSAEYQAALGSVIMQRNHRESHLKALEIVRARQEAASLKGDSAEKGTVAGIQKQMLHDGGSNMPWAVGDQARGAMENGMWGGIDESGVAQAGHGVTLNQQMQERVGTHMSVEKLAGMNPDELKSVHKMAKNGQLNPKQLTAVQEAIKKLRTDEQYKGSEKPNASPLYDEILGTANGGIAFAVDPTTGKSTRYNEDSVF